MLFQLQIYTIFESNSQLRFVAVAIVASCSSCKYTQFLKAIHNYRTRDYCFCEVVPAANIHNF